MNLIIFDFLDLLVNSPTNCHNIHKTISGTSEETKLVMFASSVTGRLQIIAMFLKI